MRLAHRLDKTKRILYENGFDFHMEFILHLRMENRRRNKIEIK